MIILLGEKNGEPGYACEIKDGDFVTPLLLQAQGHHFPRATFRMTFRDGGPDDMRITVERNSDWGGNCRAPRGTPANP